MKWLQQQVTTLAAGGSAGDSLRARLVRGGVGSVAIKLSGMGLSFGINVVLARSLGPAGLGTYAFAFSVVTLLSVPVQLGLPTLLTREVARYEYQHAWGELRGLLRRSTQAVLVVSAVVALIALGVAWWVRGRTDQVQLATLAWALLLVPLVSLGRLRDAALQGLRHVIQGLLPTLLLQPAFLLILVAAAAWAGALTPPRAMALYCVAAGLAFIPGALWLSRRLPHPVRTADPLYETRRWMRSVVPLALMSGLTMINGQVDIVMLGLLGTKEEVALYRVAFSGAALVLLAVLAVNAAIAPHCARLFAARDQSRLQRVVTLSTRLTFGTAAAAAGGLVLLGGPILEWVFGPAYRPAYPALAILSIGQLAAASAGPARDLLNMAGLEHETLRAVAGALGLNVVLNAVLIPLLGSSGAAAATAVSIVAGHVLLCRALWTRTGIWSAVAGRSLGVGHAST